MKKDVRFYEAPVVEVIEVEVEKGFQASNGASTEDIGYGDSIPMG